MQADHFDEFEAKLREAHMGQAVVRAFRHNYEALLAGQTGMLPESAITPVTDLPRFETHRLPG